MCVGPGGSLPVSIPGASLHARCSDAGFVVSFLNHPAFVTPAAGIFSCGLGCTGDSLLQIGGCWILLQSMKN